jgi:putative flippase GtrA
MINNLKIKQWIRFLVGGGINTAFTYGIYLILMLFVHYQIAYLIAYIVGVVFAYWFNAVIVFKVPLSWKGLFSYPIIYIIQYTISAFLLDIFVETLQIDKTFAPLMIIIIIIPLTYVLNKYVLLISSPTNKR